MKAENMESAKGNKIANQFIIRENDKVFFQSYNSIIVEKNVRTGEITLDSYYWNYSKTTSKFRSQFLGESTKETQKKIDAGVYKLVNLNERS